MEEQSILLTQLFNDVASASCSKANGLFRSSVTTVISEKIEMPCFAVSSVTFPFSFPVEALVVTAEEAVVPLMESHVLHSICECQVMMVNRYQVDYPEPGHS